MLLGELSRGNEDCPGKGQFPGGVRAGGELSGECLVIINGYTINSASYDKN